jgi:hypothetical protein
MSISDKIKRKVKELIGRNSSGNEGIPLVQNPSLLHLHLGCGSNYLDGWVNVDVMEECKADMIMNFKDIKKNFQPDTVGVILMIHSISYLRLWEARDFFSDAISLIRKGGKLILEFPDIAKCSKALLDSENKVTDYLEAVRAIYAFDMEQIQRKEPFYTYTFGWSTWHISHELKKAGFTTIEIMAPQTHGPRVWRDTRIEAIK